MEELNIKNKIIKYFDNTFIIGLFSIICYYFVFNDFGTILVYIIRTMFPSIQINTSSYAAYRALSNAIIYMFLFVILIYLNRSFIKEDYNKYHDQGNLTLYVLIFVCFAFFLNLASSVWARQITNGLDISTSENQSSIDSIMNYLPGVLIFAPITVIVAPIVEELIFRKSFFNVIKNKYLALLISVFVFGTMHVTSTYSLLLTKGYSITDSLYYTFGFGLSYYAMGISFGLSYIKSDKNILVPIAIHMANNFVATAASIILIPLFF